MPFFLISRVLYTHNGKAEEPPAGDTGCNWDPALNCPLEESLILPLRQTRLTPPGQAKTCVPGYSQDTVIWFRKQTRSTGSFGCKKNKWRESTTNQSHSLVWVKHKIQECSATGNETGNSQNHCFIASHERSVSTTTKQKQNKIKDRCFLLDSSQFTNQWCSAIEQKDSWPAFWSATEIHNGRNLGLTP